MKLFKKRKHKDADFWSRPAMVPTAAGEVAGGHAARARRWRRLVRANFIAFPVLVLALVMTVTQLITTSVGSRDGDGGDGVPTAVRAEALDAVDDWIGSDNPPLTGARVIGWNGATELAWPDAAEEKDRTYTVWVAHVLVSTDTAVYDVGVRIDLDGAGASVAGSPSLEMIPPAASTAANDTGWPGTVPVSASDAVTRAVQAWAQAYTSGDRTRLTTVIADPDASHAYLPVSGFTGATATVNGAAYHAYRRGGDPDTSELMVSVTLAVERDGLDKPARIGFDLLVSDPTTGAARVTAWGAPGTGPTLTPYANAVGVGGADIPTAHPTATPGATTPAPTATPGATTPAPTATPGATAPAPTAAPAPAATPKEN